MRGKGVFVVVFCCFFFGGGTDLKRGVLSNPESGVVVRWISVWPDCVGLKC